jgi:riboflavin synthase
MMFTGIVEEVGTVVRIENLADAARLVVRGPLVTSDATPGASIAVNGVCLTVTDLRAAAGTFAADLMAETLRRSSLGAVTVGSSVNLERAVRVDARLGGHVVQGHVDGVATLVARTPGEHWDAVRFEIPRQLARFVVEKGSIAVDGVSLTVTAVSPATEEAAWFEVGLIPTTLDLTTLGSAPVGRGVNIEVDVVAKYVGRIAAFAAADGAR